VQRQQKEFLAVVAHELRNPLTPIRIAAEMLGLARPEEIPRYQAIIENEVEHMVRLVSDLVDMSRINAGKLRIERRIVDLTDIVDEAVAACRPAMDTRLQHFSVRVPARAIKLDADPVRLAQVLRNLLDNASKYTPNGGEVGLSVVVADDTVVVSVSDSGIGITAGALPEVFEPFVQDKHAIGFNGVGLGIGLTVVRELVDAHGGHVVASSAGTGLGSQFVVTLPLTGHKSGNALQR
jgi:signal transduction histidine kinase